MPRHTHCGVVTKWQTDPLTLNAPLPEDPVSSHYRKLLQTVHTRNVHGWYHVNQSSPAQCSLANHNTPHSLLARTTAISANPHTTCPRIAQQPLRARSQSAGDRAVRCLTAAAAAAAEWQQQQRRWRPQDGGSSSSSGHQMVSVLNMPRHIHCTMVTQWRTDQLNIPLSTDIPRIRYS
jgi:hypothetical protein